MQSLEQKTIWRDRWASLRNIPPVLHLVWQAAPGVVASGLALRVSSALIPLGALLISKSIIDLLVQAAKHRGSSHSEVWILLAAEFALAGLGAIASRAIDYSDARLADEFTREVGLRVMEHANGLDLASFEDPAFHDKLERARVQATDRIGMLNAMGRLLLQSITLVSLSVGVAIYSPWLLALLVACVIPAFAGESHFAFLGYRLAHRPTPIRRELDYLRVLGSSKDSVKEVKIFGLGDHLRSRYEELSGELIRKNRALTQRRLGWGSVLAIVASLGYYGSFAYLVWQTLLGEISIGTLTFLAGAIAGSSSQLQSVFSLFGSISDQALFLTDLVDFLAVQPRIQSKPNAIPAPRPICDGFQFCHVSFHYPGAPRLVLDHLNFRVEPGEHVALVGENGQGKTTLVKLMARLYDPTAGVILLDGVDLRDYRVEDLHEEIGIIFQDFMRYDMTARMNIGMGRLACVHQDETLWNAANKSGANRAVKRFETGLDQMLGRRFESGVDLSGGEWQKIALARAYLRNAQVLILDEPTASLDAVAESEVFARFSDLARGSTVILIAHRFSTVRRADRIVVLEDGKVREQGTHDQLVSSSGRYARLFELQAANYR